MRFPIGYPVPVGVWRETPPPPDSLSSPKREGGERRQGSPHATHLGPLAPAFLLFAVFLTNVRAVGPPPHCRLFSSHAFTLLNFQFLNLVLLATVSQIATLRDELLEAARLAPSSFNSPPYRLFWVSSCDSLRMVAQLCFSQPLAETASALVVAVADIGAWRSTTLGQLEWLRASGFSPEKIAEFERKSELAKWFSIQGYRNLLGALKWLAFRAINLFKIIGMPPVPRQGLFKWATKSTSLACENLMIAAESFGLNTCPVEGFDARRLARFLRLSSRDHEIVMVIAIGKKSPRHMDQPQWRRPLESTVTIL
jgi:nitroreductase